jgi:hypothetical protein
MIQPLISGSAPRKTIVNFWDGKTAEIELETLARSALPVKGVLCPNPLRFLEIYAEGSPDSIVSSGGRTGGIPDLSIQGIERTFLRGIPGGIARLTEISLAPFTWRDADPEFLAVSFTYNASAFFRIFSGLQRAGKIPVEAVNTLVDQACQLLTRIYKANSFFVIRNINNNINMMLISRTVEFLVGKQVYDADMQEMDITSRSLSASLLLATENLDLPLKDLMGLAVTKGIAFIESRLGVAGLGRFEANQVRDVTWRRGRNLAIDDRDVLISMISNAGHQENSFDLVVIFDDAAESVDDFLWIMTAITQFPFLKITLIVNTAQISINFSEQMLDRIQRAPCFRGLATHWGDRLKVLTIYCPLISFQTEFLPLEAREAIAGSNAVFVKGANFFETCQIQDKPAFHAFVVYGPVSRRYTGLHDFDPVFVFVPAGRLGYARTTSSMQVPEKTARDCLGDMHVQEGGAR